MTEIADLADENWWDVDPFLDGYGLGMVLHETRRGDSVCWIVARTLRDSPASESGIRAGDQIDAIGPLTAATHDLDDIAFYLRRPRDVSWVVRTVDAQGRAADFSLSPKPLRAMMTEDLKGSGELKGGACISCHLCAPRANGWATCIIDGECADRCLTA